MIPSLNEEQLRKIGGWQAIQEARRMVDLGAIRTLDVSRAGEGCLTGTMASGGTDRRVVFRWKDEREASAACACPAARRGIVCAHALALGVAFARHPNGLTPSAVPDTPKITPIRQESDISAIGVKSKDKIFVSSEKQNSEQVLVCWPSGLSKSWKNASLPVLFKRLGKNASSLESGVGENVLLDWLSGHLGRVAALPPAMRLAGESAAAFLTWLAGRQASVAGPDGICELESQPWRPVFSLGRDPVEAGMVTLTADPPEEVPVTGVPGWWMVEESGRSLLRRAPDWAGLPAALAQSLDQAARSGGSVRLAANQFLRFSDALDATCILSGEIPGFSIDASAPEFLLELDGSTQHLSARLTADYSACRIPLPCPDSAAREFPRELRENDGAFRDRHPAAEADALAVLEKAGFRPDKNDCNQFILKGENHILTFYASMGRCLPARWEVRFGARWQRAVRDLEVASFRFAPRPADAGWLEGEIACATDSGYALSRADLHRLLRGGRSGFHAPGGKMVVVDLALAAELEEVWQDVGASQTRPGCFRFDARQEAYVRQMLGLPGATRPPGPVLDTSSAGPSFALLRPYQRDGVAWLASQADHDLGAVLADDMGLGKTLQSLVFLEWQRRGGASGPALVVCPTTLLSNWRDEAAKFCPDWKVLVQHGTARKDYWEVMDAADLVLTTHALLARDAEQYARHEFRAVVLDEASLIRNPDAKIARAAHAVRGRVRIALTGTPVENSARDLWSVFQFVQPGYLGSRQDFRQRFELPLAAGDEALAARLQKRVQPLLLRRLKTEVAKDLPARLETTEWCDLDPAQAALYNAILRESRDNLAQSIRKEGFAKARMGVLTALLRLRQICCDPGLVVDRDAGSGGAKRDLFRELLREAVEGGHRVLVFSQFVGMLERLRADVEDLGVGYSWLTGGTADRGEQVRRFQDGSHPVFLLSLKAGGYGLTLTAADTVILYDPWWNPAVEAQAIDRAHRIGQIKVVNAYRLATRGTVEEKILRLQEKKRGLANRMLGDSGQLMDGLQEADLRDLLGL